MYIISLNKKLKERTRGFLSSVFSLSPLTKHLEMELWPNLLAPFSWAFIIDDATTAFLRYSYFTLMRQ